MTVTSVFPPQSTPGGWYGCFGPPKYSHSAGPYAFPVSGQLPCSNDTIASCCLLTDQCMGNGVCRIIPDINNHSNISSYYSSYCTDPTFSSPECAQNCRMYLSTSCKARPQKGLQYWQYRLAELYMVACGSNIWQCYNAANRDSPFSTCDFSSTQSPYSTFFMVDPTNLAYGPTLPAIEPSTTQTQYVPTQWGVPTAQTSTILTSSVTQPTTSSTATSSHLSPSSSLSLPAAPTATTQGGHKSLSAGDIGGIVGAAVGFVAIITGLLGAVYPQELKAVFRWTFTCACFKKKRWIRRLIV